MNRELEAIFRLAHSPLHNYAMPGLTSYLIGEPSERGCIRLFHMERHETQSLTPHSHRFDFTARVLQGRVGNIIWEPDTVNTAADLFTRSIQEYNGEPGHYETRDDGQHWYRPKVSEFTEGETYSMNCDQIHSIEFTRGTCVLMMEGPKKSNTSIVIEPYDAKCQVTSRILHTPAWMFAKPKEQK